MCRGYIILLRNQKVFVLTKLLPQIAAAGVILGAVLSTPAPAQNLTGESFNVADVDRSDTLTQEEFNHMIDLLANEGHRNARYVRTFRLYSVAFHRVDKNSDGIATRYELSTTRMMFEKSEASADSSFRKNL